MNIKYSSYSKMISLEEALETKKFTLEDKEFTALVTKVYDGDTIHVVFEYKGEYNKWVCRLYGVDTAEIRTKDLEEKEFAIETRDALRDRILHQEVQIKCYEFDKYGRLLATIIKDDVNINEWLIEEGYAKPYFGGTKS